MSQITLFLARDITSESGRNRATLSLAGTLIVLLSVCSLAFGQTVGPNAERPSFTRSYQAEQRAKRLLELEPEVAKLPDVEIRCELRVDILRFIYSSDAVEAFPSADAVLRSLLEEIEASQKQLGSRSKYWKNSLALVLRAHAPETAKWVETKYVPDVDTSGEDLHNAAYPAKRDEIVDRAIANIDKSRYGGEFVNIYEAIRRGDPPAAHKMTTAALDLAERHPGPDAITLLNWIFDAVFNPPASPQTPEDTVRYYRCLIAGAKVELANPRPGAPVTFSTPLRHALPAIKQVDPSLYAQAQDVIGRYRKTLSEEARAWEEAQDRIEYSDDKIEQAISEANAATSQSLKDHLWSRAAQLCVQKRYYRRAVDLLMNATPNLSFPDHPNARDLSLWNSMIRDAANKKDYESAQYAADHIQDGVVKGNALMYLGDAIGSWEAKDRPHAAEVIKEGLWLVEKGSPDVDSICWAGNGIHAVPSFEATDQANYDEFVSGLVSMMNRVSMNGSKAKAGTPERAAFVGKIIARGLICAGAAFNPSYTGIPAPDITDKINLNEWRLAARIHMEMNRRYPVPQIVPDQARQP